jgi:uncharacterized membrane protein YjgN (DUF898 family)
MESIPSDLPANPGVPRIHMGNSPLSTPQQLAMSDTHPVEFSGSGSEYFRIWIVNLLLILVTFGIYMPWAKVRRLKYFYGNTRIDGDALDFHGEAQKMLRGTLIAGVFFGVYSMASGFSAWAGLLAGLVFVAVWPVLYRASLKFRLHNSSWRGIRMHLAPSTMHEVYWAVLPPNLLLIVPFAMLAFEKADLPLQGAADMAWNSVIGVFVVLFVVSLPYFLWRINRYRIEHSAWGPLRMEFRSHYVDMYKVVLKTAFMTLLIFTMFVAIALMLVPGLFSGLRTGARGLSTAWLLIPLFIGFMVCMNILPRAYYSAHSQNLLWSRMGNKFVRFKSDLAAGPYMLLQLKNYVLIAITFGLYWPFAVVATRRMEIEAVSLKTRVALNTLTDQARQPHTDALGDMAADMFDMDMGI